MTIERLNQSTPTMQGSVAFHDPQAGADRRATFADVAALLQDSRTPWETFYASPPATGFNAVVDPSVHGTSSHVMLMPNQAVTSLTVTLPTTPGHGQEVLVTSTAAIGALTIVGNKSGAPSTVAAGGYFTLRYDGVHGLWVRVA